ncbi:MAG TPA: endonuclease domain-containing protein [Sphingomonadaceae bacterium]|nr:endonuclease domain-containing protein [Sphingomonadaceae bacterium]
MLQGVGDTGEHARDLRRTMSLPEVLLWQALRKRPAGLRFRRQHPSGPYVADFYCHAARLIVEVDGEAHDRGGRPARDARRDAWFRRRGLAVMRVPARDVLASPEAVAEAIGALASAPLHRPAGGPPPRAGEDQE